MNLAARLRVCVAIVLVMGLSCYVVSERDALLALVACPLLGIGLWFTRPAVGNQRGLVLPGLVVPMLILGASIVAMFQARAIGFDVTLISSFAIALMLIKLGDRRAPRDEGQLIALAAFLAVAAVLTSPELLVGVQAIVFFPLLVYTVMVYQLYRAQMEAAPEHAGGPGVGPTRPIARAGALATLACMGLGFVIFVITPRGLGDGFLGSLNAPRAGTTTGFTDTVSLGRRGVISESPAVVMDVRARRRGEPTGGDGQSFYLRGAVLDNYDHATASWKPATRQFPAEEFGGGVNPRRGLTWESVGSLELEITLRSAPKDDAFLFTVWRPTSLTFDRSVRVRSDRDTGVFRASANASGAFTYRVRADTSARDGDKQRHDMSVDFPSDVIRERAREILRDAGIEPDPAHRPWAEDQAGARAIADSFLTGFEYTLEQPPVTPGVDPIEEFLFATRRGHCEYFAASMAALCRGVGIRARVVTGYVANEFDAGSGSYIVREDDAHAWIEVQAGEHNRWLRFDPTPPEDLRRIQERSRSLVSTIRRMLDSLEFAWNQSVVFFDNEDRRRILPYEPGGRSNWMRGVGNFIARFVGPERAQRGNLVAAILTGITVACVTAGGALLGRALFLRRRHARGKDVLLGGHPSRALRESVSLYGTLLALWDRAKLSKPAWRPPMAHARLMTEDAGAARVLREAADAVVGLLYATRFGAQDPPVAEFDRARELLARAEEAARTQGR